jgi:hypothetical protein
MKWRIETGRTEFRKSSRIDNIVDPWSCLATFLAELSAHMQKDCPRPGTNTKCRPWDEDSLLLFSTPLQNPPLSPFCKGGFFNQPITNYCSIG